MSYPALNQLWDLTQCVLAHSDALSYRYQLFINFVQQQATRASLMFNVLELLTKRL